MKNINFIDARYVSQFRSASLSLPYFWMLHISKGLDQLFYERYGRWGIDKIWRDDVLPCALYLR